MKELLSSESSVEAVSSAKCARDAMLEEESTSILSELQVVPRRWESFRSNDPFRYDDATRQQSLSRNANFSGTQSDNANSI